MSKPRTHINKYSSYEDASIQTLRERKINNLCEILIRHSSHSRTESVEDIVNDTNFHLVFTKLETALLEQKIRSFDSSCTFYQDSVKTSVERIKARQDPYLVVNILKDLYINL